MRGMSGIAEKMKKLRLSHYIVFAAVITATFLYLGIAGRDAVPLSVIGLVLALAILNWKRFSEPVRLRRPSLSEIVSVATLLLAIAAIVSIIVAAERVGIDLAMLLTDKALLVCTWLTMILLPVPRLLKRPGRAKSGNGSEISSRSRRTH